MASEAASGKLVNECEHESIAPTIPNTGDAENG